MEMRGRATIVIPEKADLISFFESEPIEEHQGFSLFQVADPRGVAVRFSYDLFERSVQTAIDVLGQSVSIVSHEELTTISFHDGSLVALCEYGGIQTQLTVDVRPNIKVEWSSLVIK